LTSDLDSTKKIRILYRINIDWGLNYDGFMTMYDFTKMQGILFKMQGRY